MVLAKGSQKSKRDRQSAPSKATAKHVPAKPPTHQRQPTMPGIGRHLNRSIRERNVSRSFREKRGPSGSFRERPNAAQSPIPMLLPPQSWQIISIVPVNQG